MEKWGVSQKKLIIELETKFILYSEKDIDEVLQTHTVFINVSKGQVAKKEDLVKAFGIDNQTEICKEILKKGELQVSDKERQSQIDQTFKDIANIVAQKCINPEMKRPYPVSVIQEAMKKAHFSVKLTQNSKQQALQVIKMLKEIMPIDRAQMKIRIVATAKYGKKLKEKLQQIESFKMDNESIDDDQMSLQFFVDPGEYRYIEEIVKAESKGTAMLEILSYSEIVLEEESL